MSTWIVVVIFIVVLGIIFGNIMILKDTAKTKMPSLKDKTDNNAKWDEED
ncbi:DUF2897 family protein [Alteromonadaceae bacterium BrNp21-10]|nr:DUF2897 family protein [Alteromonadaceae bacterium BrNp21-10]